MDEGTVCLPSRAFNDRRIRGSHLRILAAIAELGEGGIAQRQIASLAGMEDRNARRYVADLIKFLYLEVHRIDGYVSVYRIVKTSVEGGYKMPSPPKLGSSLPTPPTPPSPPAPSHPPLTPPTLSSPRQIARARGKRLAENFKMPAQWMDDGAAARKRAGYLPAALAVEAEKFINHFLSMAGQKANKCNWHRTWINWCLSARGFADAAGRQSAVDALREGAARAAAAVILRDRSRGDFGNGLAPARPFLDGQ